MRAALRAEYGLDLRQVMADRTIPVGDLTDLVLWLPAGCAFWAAVGGPAAISEQVNAIQRLDYSVRVLDYHQRGGKGPKPKEPQTPPYAHERRAAESNAQRKADAYLRRQANQR